MKKMFTIFIIGFLILLLTACTSGKPNKNLSAEDVFDKAKEASKKLEKVQTHIIFDDTKVTSEPVQREKSVFDIKSNAHMNPTTFYQKTNVKFKQQTKDLELYKFDDQAFVKDVGAWEWEKLDSGSIAEIYSPIVAYSNPTLDLSLFDEFKDDFELTPVDYGYSLRLEMTKPEYERFKEILNESETGQKEVKDATTDDFLLIMKLEFEIIVDSRSFYVTDFKMLTDTTTYTGRDFVRSKEKVSAYYSRFDDIEDVKVPKELQETASR